MSLDFSTPIYLVIFYHISGTISFFLNTATIYLIIFKSSKIDNFRYFLLVFQILCTITDFHLTFLMQPIPLFPIISGFCTGFLAQELNVWSHYLMATIISLMIAQMECLAFCFARKHQTIGKIMNRHVFPKIGMILVTVVSVILPIFFFWAFCKAGIERSKQMDFVRENYPQYFFSFSSLSNFAIYDLNHWFLFLAIFTLFGGSIAGFIFIFTTIDMFKMLKGAQRKVSIAHYQRHQAAVKSLLAQFATSSLCLVPPFVFVIVIISEFRYAQGTVQLLLALFALHSSVNAIVLIATTPPYRNFVLRKPPKLLPILKVSHTRNSFH